jgi:hypothetical protein
MYNGNAAALQAKTPCSSRTVYQQRMEGKKHLLHSIHHLLDQLIIYLIPNKWEKQAQPMWN